MSALANTREGASPLVVLLARLFRDPFALLRYVAAEGLQERAALLREAVGEDETAYGEDTEAAVVADHVRQGVIPVRRLEAPLAVTVMVSPDAAAAEEGPATLCHKIHFTMPEDAQDGRMLVDLLASTLGAVIAKTPEVDPAELVAQAEARIRETLDHEQARQAAESN